MKLTIFLEKDVADRDEARTIFQMVKARLADRPGVTVIGQLTDDVNDTSPPDPPG